MATPEVLFTDGYDVRVTSSKLEVKGLTYWLSAIQRHNLAIVKRDGIIGLMCVFIGIAFLLFGMLLLITPPAQSEVTWAGMVINPGLICLIGGVVIMALGAIMNALRKEKFALRIFTDLGPTDVLVSTRKEYITKIANALDEAFFRLDLKKTKRGQAFV